MLNQKKKKTPQSPLLKRMIAKEEKDQKRPNSVSARVATQHCRYALKPLGSASCSALFAAVCSSQKHQDEEMNNGDLEQ